MGSIKKLEILKNNFMLIFLALFGLGIALFQTLILLGLYNLNLRPRWIVFAITPLTIIISGLIDDEIAMFTLFAHFTSVFLLAIIGMVIKSVQGSSGDNERPLKGKKTPTAIQYNPQQFKFNPLLGIIYQLYIIIIIFLHIFIPKSDIINTELLMNDFFNQIYFQVFSIFSLLIFSVTYLLYRKILNFDREILSSRFTNENAKIFASNRALSIYTIIAGILVFNYFFDVRKNIPVLIENLSNPSVYNLHISFFVYWLYQITLIVINPKEATFLNLAKAKTFFKSAHLGIFMGAALVPIFLIIESKLDYFNMNSEIILFLGFNIVLMVTEIVTYRKIKNSTFTTSIL